jgi:hypothetical protein
MSFVGEAKRACFLFVVPVAFFISSCALPQYDSSVATGALDLHEKIRLQMNNWASGVANGTYNFAGSG